MHVFVFVIAVFYHILWYEGVTPPVQVHAGLVACTLIFSPWGTMPRAVFRPFEYSVCVMANGAATIADGNIIGRVRMQVPSIGVTLVTCDSPVGFLRLMRNVQTMRDKRLKRKECAGVRMGIVRFCAVDLFT